MKSLSLPLLWLAMLSAAVAGGQPLLIEGASPLQWSERLASSEISRLGTSLFYGGSDPRARWDYSPGVLALSLVRLGEFTGNTSFRDFGIQAVASHVQPDGVIRGYSLEEHNLDKIEPGRVLLSAIEQGDRHEEWIKVVRVLHAQLATQPRTSEGGFWHKKIYPHQMWLDGLFMASPFLAQYASLFGEPGLYDEVARQILLMDRHAYDPLTGLYWHAWDESLTQGWADPKTGHSPSFWSRSIGWYAMAIVDVLDYLPDDHPDRPRIVAVLRRLADGIVKWQDPKSGVWWQVTDQADRSGNYVEASASAMFVYALAKGVNQGSLPSDPYIATIRRGYEGLICNFVKENPDGSIRLTRICQSAGLGFKTSDGRPRDGSFNYYISEPIADHDPKGTGPFILAGIETERMFGNSKPRPLASPPRPPDPSSSASPRPHRPKIVLVGDSTVTERLGWGLGFTRFLTDRVDCINTALNGRSSKSFRAEGHWEPSLALHGDYYLIQFGHNDQPGKGPDRETDIATYSANMARYVDEVRAIGAQPVLVTSLTRRDFDQSGHIKSSLTSYVEALRKIATEKHVPLLDLNASSTAFCEKLGPLESARFNPLKDGKPDTTHLNAEGSVAFARLVADDLRGTVPTLAPYLREEPAPAPQVQVIRDIPYGEASGESLLLDAHVPEGKGPFPVAILVHGGGWGAGDKGEGTKPGNGADISPWFSTLSEAGFTWFSINYRLAPKNRWPACLEDLQTAIRWVKAHASDYKGDPNRIALFGHSAGGHLVCLAATLASEDTRVQAVLGFAPVSNHEQDLPDRGGLSTSLQKLLDRPKETTPESLSLLRDISPLNHVRQGLPPFLLLHGDADKTVPIRQSQDFLKALQAAGVPCDLLVIPGGSHGLGDWIRHVPDYQTRMIAWLKKAMGEPSAAPWVPDLGDGTYKNPVLQADYSDPDAIRVGDDYWMTASSFNHVPGLPVLHSKDLVNWDLVGHALPRLIPEENFSVPRHGCGVWAPSLRFHDGKYWIYYPDPDFGIYVITATDPKGPWSAPSLVKAGKGLIDPCPIWDEEGKVYLVYAWAKSRSGIKNTLSLLRLDHGGTKVEDDFGHIIKGDDLPGCTTLEGPKFYKRNGWYYIFAPAGGVKTGWQSVFRSRDIRGPYEQRIVMDQGGTPVNGPHQGALIDTPSGEWWFLHFQDQEAYGRVVHLQPVAWQDDWPVIGEDRNGSGKGEPVLLRRKPALPFQPLAVPATSDDFKSSKLGLQWQWQANPGEGWYSLTEKPGALRLQSRTAADPNLWSAPYLLLQKFPAREFTVTTELELAPGSADERAGLVIFGSDYALIGLRRTMSGFEVFESVCRKSDKGTQEEVLGSAPVTSGKVQLRVAISNGGLCRFSYSTDGGAFLPLGDGFTSLPGRWVGAKVGIFADHHGVETGGHADFAWFHVVRFDGVMSNTTHGSIGSTDGAKRD